jgi:hypothetical protein
MQQPTTLPFWFEPISVFGSSTFTVPLRSSLVLDLPSSLALVPPLRWQFTGRPRVRSAVPRDGGTLSRWLPTASLPRPQASLGYCGRNRRFSSCFPHVEQFLSSASFRTTLYVEAWLRSWRSERRSCASISRRGHPGDLIRSRAVRRFPASYGSGADLLALESGFTSQAARRHHFRWPPRNGAFPRSAGRSLRSSGATSMSPRTSGPFLSPCYQFRSK